MVRTRDWTWFTELLIRVCISGHINFKWNIRLFSTKHQGALVLVHEELWWQSWLSACNDYEHQQAPSGVCLHSVCVSMCMCKCMCVCVCVCVYACVYVCVCDGNINVCQCVTKCV